LIARRKIQSTMRPRVLAHHTVCVFLLAARHSSGTMKPARTPALWVLDGIGEDAGRHVQQLIAAFARAPCGQAWAPSLRNCC
jgi:hypothetical protein